MKLLIDNILSYEEKSIDLETGANLVTGLNSAGKTNLALIIGALAAHEPNPKGLTVGDKRKYLNLKTGAVEGLASMNGVEWSPSDGLSIPNGQEPVSLPHAVGLVDFVSATRDKRKRAERWEDLFLPDDPEAILRPRWTLSEKQLQAALEEINASGWDKAEGIFVGKRRDAKRKWKNIAGQDYGADKAVKWVPENWREDLVGASEEALMATLTDARDLLREKIAVEAVTQDQIEKSREVRDSVIPGLEAKVKELNEKENQLQQSTDRHAIREAEQRATLKKIRDKLDRAKTFVNQKAPYNCPICKTGLELKGVDLSSWQAPSMDDLKKADAFIESAPKKIEEMEKGAQAIAETKEAAGLVRRETAQELFDAKAELHAAKMSTRWAEHTHSQQALSDSERNRMEEDIARASHDLEAFRKWQSAKIIHENIVEYDEVCDLLGPNGARASILKEGMKGVQEMVTQANEITGWKQIRISSDYAIHSGGIPVELAAENETCKAQWLMQIIAARISGSEIVVLDGADKLKDESWDGLINLVEWALSKMSNTIFVVCATSAMPIEGWNTINLNQ